MIEQIRSMHKERLDLIVKLSRLKTKSAQRKYWDKIHQLDIELSFLVQDMLPKGTVLDKCLYCHDAMGCGLGDAIGVTVYSVQTSNITCVINNEIVQIPYGTSYYGLKNFKKLFEE